MKTLIESLVESVVDEMSKYPETAAEYARQLNDESQQRSSGFSSFGLSEKQENWASMGIHTGYDLAHMLATEAYINMYKEIYNYKPRHLDFSELSVDRINYMIEDLSEQENHQQQEPEPEYEESYVNDLDSYSKDDEYDNF